MLKIIKAKISLKKVLMASVTAGSLLLASVSFTPAFADEHGSGSKGSGHTTDHSDSDHGSKGQQKGKKTEVTGQGSKGLGKLFRDISGAESEDEDSDRPDWAGEKGGKAGAGSKPGTAGSKKGDLFGDLWIILRDDNGVPILTPEGFVQPLDENGNLIPLDEEGHPIDESLTVEVELGRLNVGRAPSKVLDRRAEEVVTLLNSATAITVDSAGRLVLTVDGEDKTIDSPLENLAIYVALMTEGSIPGVSDLPGTEYDFLVDGDFTKEDVAAATSFLAAATDKTGEFTSDEIAYINAFLSINLETSGSQTYSVVDYSDFQYDRSSTYATVTTTVLVEQADGTWVPTEVNIYDAVFGGENVTVEGTLDAFTQAADDARMIINYIHEFEVPDASVANN
ncbi:hypothetical protein [Sneathiella limimaris]|uniref:hypothetical protein n=1 Tax=Sneathiella limimaris TaxID=1964213 RepID=UPI00146EC9EE|nr:hypothetical protein [Sneathiella limimaris]